MSDAEFPSEIEELLRVFAVRAGSCRAIEVLTPDITSTRYVLRHLAKCKWANSAVRHNDIWLDIDGHRLMASVHPDDDVFWSYVCDALVLMGEVDEEGEHAHNTRRGGREVVVIKSTEA